MPVVAATLALLMLPAAPAASQEDTPEQRIDRLFEAYDPAGPGVAVAVIRNGELVFAKGYGSANLEHAVPITSESVFYLASLSKQFTGFAIAMLVADGRLSLDDPVHMYIPELPHYGAPLRVRHLLHHTSGLRNIFALAGLMRGGGESDLITHEAAHDIIMAQRETNFEPGAEFLYSNAGYALLATIVERVSGRSFPRFMQDEVLGPLRMTGASVPDDHERIIPGRAESYKRTSQGELRKVVAPLTVQGATGVYGSAEDLARWLANLDDPGVGGDRVVDIMHQHGWLENGEPLNYGAGLDFGGYNGLSLVGHGGDFIGYRTWAGRVPEHGLGVVVLANGPDTPDPFHTFLEVVEIYLGRHMEARPASAFDPDRFPRVTGDYISDTGFPVQLLAAGDTLYGSAGGGPLRPLMATGDSVFSGLTPWGASFRITLQPASDGATLTLYGTSRLRPATPAGSSTTWSPTADELAEYQGFYYSPELNTRYTVAVDGSDLIARHAGGSAIVLDPSVEDHFVGSRWFFSDAEFTRDEQGTIAGLRVSAFRLRGVLFEREN